MEYREILEFFEKGDNFLILTHKSPDGDTLGTGFALCNFLKDMGKRVRVANSDGFPGRYSFLYEGCEPDRSEEFEEEHVVAVDIADPNLIGKKLEKYQQEGAVDLCIDHHFSNKKFARMTHIEADAPAAAQIMYKIFKESGREITDIIAKCLYTGIATDTGCFKYESTTPETHIIAAELMKHDIDFANINRKMFDVKSRERIKVEQLVTNNMEFYFEGACAMITLSSEMTQGIDPAEFDGLASVPLSVEGVMIGLTVKQRHERVYKISARTTEEIDASDFCSAFDGGGHKRAAGCEIHGTLEEVRQKLLDRVEQVLKNV